MTKFENDLYQQYYDTLAWESDVVIYIRTPPEVCYERMNSRARECESNVPLSYLQQVHQKYEELYDNIVHNKKQKLYIVDGIQSSEQVYEQVMNIINTL
jgi:thymidylate kinase